MNPLLNPSMGPYEVIGDGDVKLGLLGVPDNDKRHVLYPAAKYASRSVTNPYCVFGGKYGPLSPYNKYSSNPPKVFDKNGQFVAYLTTNKFLSPRIDPAN